jgi:hydrogenase maturation protein HypF
MAEYGKVGPGLAIVMDGTGYGDDETVWGGEFLEVTVQGYTRLGHLKQIPLPGGDKAVWEPWRMAAAYLERIYGDLQGLHIPFAKELDLERWSQLQVAMKARINAPLCSSMGRLFDAVSALLNVRGIVNYEGQAAVELEQLAKEGELGEYAFKIFEHEERLIIDPDPIIEGIVNDIQLKENPSVISACFHNSITQIIAQMAVKIRERTGLSDVFLSGGVFQNPLLLEKAWDILAENGFRVYIHKKIPPNDGCISLGQAYYALHL